MCTYSVRGYSKLDIALRYFLSSFSFFLTFYFHFFVSVCGFDVLIQCGSFIDGHVALSSILHLLCSIQPWSFQISTVKVFPNATCICVTVSFLLNLPFLIMFPSLTLCFLEFTILPPLTYQYMTHCLSFGLVLILFFSSSFAVYRFALVFSSFSLFLLFFSTLSSNPDVWNLRAWRYLSAYKSFDCQSCLVLWTGPFLLSEARIIQGWVTVLDEYSLEFFPSYRRGIQLNRFLYTVKKDSVMD